MDNEWAKNNVERLFTLTRHSLAVCPSVGWCTITARYTLLVHPIHVYGYLPTLEVACNDLLIVTSGTCNYTRKKNS